MTDDDMKKTWDRSQAAQLVLMKAATDELAEKRANAGEILLALAFVAAAFGMTLADGKRGKARDTIGEAIDIALEEMDDHNQRLASVGGITGISKMASQIAKEKGQHGTLTVDQIRANLAEAKRRLRV
jgi:hypothetical protein